MPEFMTDYDRLIQIIKFYDKNTFQYSIGVS